MRRRTLYPRRAQGLPAGQRELDEMPRFSDQPLRPPPAKAPIELLLSVNGKHHATLSAHDLEQFETIEQTNDFHCVTTWSVRNLVWGGYRLIDILEGTLGPDLPPFASAAAADKQKAMFSTEDLVTPNVLLATHLNHQPLTAKHGAPLRLVCPNQYGYKSPKHLTGIDFVTSEPKSTLGPKEHLRARVALEERHAKLPNWLLRVPYRLLIAPTALAARRGLRSSPGQ